MKRLLERAVTDAVLTNRLDGSFSGPLNALVTTLVYAQDRQSVLIPSGARVLGHRLAGPVVRRIKTRRSLPSAPLADGTSYTLDKLPGLNDRGDAGLKDQGRRDNA